jgi:hypothetical protein
MSEIQESVVPTKKAFKEYPFIKSEKVWIHRAKKKPVLPELGVVGETARDHQLRIGASFAGPQSGVLLGRVILTAEEERKYMPAIVGVQPTHQEWDKVLNEYWANLQVNIPYDGLQLEIGYNLISETEKEPLNVMDWILYKYCLRYSGVANTIGDVGSSTNIRFYLFKDSEEKAARTKLKQLKDEAVLARMEVEKDTERMNSIIILSGNVLQKYLAENQMLITDIADSNPAKFLELYKDKNLLEKAFVERLIGQGIMTRPVNSTLVIYDGNQVGSNLEEVTFWLKQPANSATLLTLREQLRLKEQN